MEGSDHKERKADTSGSSTDGKLTLKVKTLGGGSYEIRVDSKCPVPRLKELLAEKTGIALASQRVIFRGKVLKDDKDISSYGLTNGHAIHVVRRPPPRARTSTSSSQEANAHSTGSSQTGFSSSGPSHSVMMGTTISVPEGQEMPDLNQLFSNVLSSIGPMLSAAGSRGGGRGLGRRGAARSGSTGRVRGRGTAGAAEGEATPSGQSEGDISIEGPSPLTPFERPSNQAISDAIRVVSSSLREEAQAANQDGDEKEPLEENVTGTLQVLRTLNTSIAELVPASRRLEEALREASESKNNRDPANLHRMARTVGVALRRLGPIFTHTGRLLCSVNMSASPPDLSNIIPNFRNGNIIHIQTSSTITTATAPVHAESAQAASTQPSTSTGSEANNSSANLATQANQRASTNNQQIDMNAMMSQMGPMLAQMGPMVSSMLSGASGSGAAGGNVETETKFADASHSNASSTGTPSARAAPAGQGPPIDLSSMLGGILGSAGGPGRGRGRGSGSGRGIPNMAPIMQMMGPILASMGQGRGRGGRGGRGSSGSAPRSQSQQPGLSGIFSAMGPMLQGMSGPSGGSGGVSILQMLGNFLPMVLGPGSTSAPLGTLLQQLAPEAANLLRDGEVGAIGGFMLAGLGMSLNEFLSLMRGDSTPLNDHARPLREAAREVVGEENTAEQRSDAAKRLAESMLGLFTFPAEDLKENMNPNEHCRGILEDHFGRMLDFLLGPEAPNPPELGPALLRCGREGLGSYLLKLEECFKNGEDDVKRTVSSSILSSFSGDDEELGEAAAFVIPLLSGEIQREVGNIMGSARRDAAGEATGASEMKGDEEKGDAPAAGWMEHLSTEERKRWSRVILRDVKRQENIRPRVHSRAYEAGSTNVAKRRRIQERKTNTSNLNGDTSSSSSSQRSRKRENESTMQTEAKHEDQPQ